MGLFSLTGPIGLRIFPFAGRGKPQAGSWETSVSQLATSRAPAFPAEWYESPERVEASAKTHSGLSLPRSNQGFRLFAKTDLRSRKTIRFSACACRGDGLLFPPRRRGNPTAGPERRETAGNGRTGKTGNRTEGPPRMSKGNRRRPGSATSRTGIPRDRRVTCGPQTARSATPPRRRGRSDLRIAPPEASARGEPARSWVPGPTKNGTRAPRGLRFRPRLPRGFLAPE